MKVHIQYKGFGNIKKIPTCIEWMVKKITTLLLNKTIETR